MRLTFRLAFVASTLASVAACSEKKVVVQSLTSQDGQLMASHVATLGGGATVGAYDDVYVDGQLTKGRRVKVISGYELGCLSLSWSAPRQLHIRYAAMSDASIGPMPRESSFALPPTDSDSLRVQYEPIPRVTCTN
jgi:hypothetical protein